MSNLRFYHDLPAFHDLRDISNPSHYAPVPADWWIALTDVRGSTKAIEAGRYKEVNGIAAASITALLNAVPELELPFVFGGDGATILIPPEARDAVAAALRATQDLAREQFQLELRIGLVPVADVLATGAAIFVGKLFVSANFQQAMFSGGGLAVADKLLKAADSGARYAIPDSVAPQADFTGFECRWSEIPATYDETISLMVQVREADEAKRNALYREVIARIEAIYGDTHARNPLSLANLRVATAPWAYRVETAIRRGTQSLATRLGLLLYSLAGLVLWKYKDRIWQPYKQIVLEATDREKFDDMLRMLISGTAAQRTTLVSYLEGLRQQGRVYYGIHVTGRALMTCLVFNRMGRQVHFVDGADGGYALAARMMKQQLAEG